MEFPIVLQLLLVVCMAAVRQPFFPHQSGIADLFLSSHIDNHPTQTSSSPYSIVLSHTFSYLPSITTSLAGLQGLSDTERTQVDITVTQIKTGDFYLVVKVQGFLSLAQVSYFVFETVSIQSLGLLFWEQPKQTQLKSMGLVREDDVQIIQKQLKQSSSGSLQVVRQSAQSIYLGRNTKVVQVLPFLKRISVFKGSSNSVNSEISQTTKTITIQISHSAWNEVELERPFYSLLMKTTTPDIIMKASGQSYFELTTLNMAISGRQEQLLTKSGKDGTPTKMILLGLNGIQHKCSSQKDILFQSSGQGVWMKVRWVGEQNHFCQESVNLSIAWLLAQEDEDRNLNFLNERMLEVGSGGSKTCPSGQCYTNWNWTALSYVNNMMSLVGGSTNSCQLCPPGCQNCNYVTNAGICYNANCTACNANYTIAIRNFTNCPIRQYCKCTNSSLFPNITNLQCQPCSTVIPFCTTCALFDFAATYCTACNSGYYGPGPALFGMPRSCAPCAPACSSCTNNTYCSTCHSGFISIGNVCQCNSTSHLYYSASTGTCTSCVSVIPQCTSCTSSTLTTTCGGCSSGNYLNAALNTCVACTTYCSTCTATACTQCVSNTLIISGTTCVCNTAGQLFLNTSSSPVSCASCTKFVANCQTCSNSTGSVKCTSCGSGFFGSGSTTCSPCVPLCTSCTSLAACSACAATFVSNGVNCVCNTSAGFILNVAGTQCVLCSLLIPNCGTCQTSPFLYCQTCSDPFYNATLDATSCSPCPVECTSCTSPTACIGCIVGYTQFGGVCNCTDCIPCSSSICANCSVCTGSACLDCMPGSYLSSSTSCSNCPIGCSTCTSNTVCNTCSSPFVFISPSCQCNTAVGQYYDSVLQTCLACQSIFVNCTACTGSGYSASCLDCEPGTYLLNSFTCQICPQNTTTCNSATNATECEPTFTLISGLCICDHAYQLFLNTTTDQCYACTVLIINCNSCISTNLTDTGVACTNCQNGFFIDPDNFTCDACPSTCTTCLLESDCTNCQPTFSLINGTCVCDASLQVFQEENMCTPCYSFINLCTDCTGTGPYAVTCLQCTEGTYLSALSTSCILCPANCVACDAGGCTNCTLGFTNSGGICDYNDTCQQYAGADPNCVDCTLQTITNVTTNSTTSNILCLACQEGFYLFAQTNCLSCQTTCTTCSSYYTCLTCQPSFTLIAGSCQCDPYANEVLYNGICVRCSSLASNCATCNSTTAPIDCISCVETFVLIGGSCTLCPTGCLKCYSNFSCSSCLPGYLYDVALMSCANLIVCATDDFVYNSQCYNCPVNCQTCLDNSTCFTCQPTYSLIEGMCECDTNSGMFTSPQNNICNQCGTFNSTIYGVYTDNCDSCTYGSASNTSGFECQICESGYYVQNGRCSSCQAGCSECTGSSSCYQCQPPVYTYSSGNCICDNSNNYFSNGSSCLPCILTNCTICSSLIQCLFCDTGYYINASEDCHPQICGNAIVEGTEQCDNGGIGDGCSLACQIELYFLCTNQPFGNSTCVPDTGRFGIVLAAQIYSCNKLQFQFNFTGSESVTSCSLASFLSSHNVSSPLMSYSLDDTILTYTFQLNQTLQGLTVHFNFKPSTLCFPYSYNYLPLVVTITINPTNNVPAIFYQNSACSQQAQVTSLVNTIQYTSYSALALSALPCKIVGLELFGVLQLAYLSLGSINNVNLMLSPLSSIKGVTGFSLDMGPDTTTSRLLQSSIFTPERINAIDYQANFIRNCNIMLLIVMGTIGVAFLLYFGTFFCKSCAPVLHRISKRIFKEVVLTLILFNELNFAYAAGIHFKYAPTEDPLYLLGTIAAIATLFIPIIMAIALQCTEEQDFGQFKDKLKPGCFERAYFVVTILYRMSIGLYLSSNNEDDLSTLIVLAVSILFLLYNLINLPFTKAYHNYRANICHITQFVVLFVAMYYRSMMSTTSIQSSAYIFTPVYFEYTCIVVSLVVSLVVLVYQIYLFVKNCFCSQERQKQLVQNGQSHEVNGMKHLHETTQVIDTLHEDKIIFQEDFYNEEAYN